MDLKASFDGLRGNVERALFFAGGTHTVDDVWDAIACGKAQFWAGVQSCIVTELHTAPQKSTLHIWLAGGTMDELRAMLPVVLAWGRAQGCGRSTIAGRRGWARTWLKDEGWSGELCLLEKCI